MAARRDVCVLGSTGSIGTQTLDVVTAAKDLYDRVEDDNERLRQENKTLQGLLEDQAGLNEQLIRQLRYCNDEIDKLKAA